jgi:hypothetical protein
MAARGFSAAGRRDAKSSKLSEKDRKTMKNRGPGAANRRNAWQMRKTDSK